MDSSPGKIKRTLQKYKEQKLVDKNLRTVSEDPKFDQSLIYQYKHKWNKFRIVGIDSLDDKSYRYIIANTEHTGFRTKVCPTQIESLNPSEDTKNFSSVSTQTSKKICVTQASQTTKDNQTGTCKLFKSFDSTAVIKSEFS